MEISAILAPILIYATAKFEWYYICLSTSCC